VDHFIGGGSTPRPADQVRVAGNPTDALDEFDSAGKTSVPSHR